MISLRFLKRLFAVAFTASREFKNCLFINSTYAVPIVRNMRMSCSHMSVFYVSHSSEYCDDERVREFTGELPRTIISVVVLPICAEQPILR